MTRAGESVGRRGAGGAAPAVLYDAAASRRPTPVFAHDLDAALRRAAEGVMALRKDGTFMLWNRAAARLLGFSAVDVAGRTCCDIFGRREPRGRMWCFPGCPVRTFPGEGETFRTFEMVADTKAGCRVWLTMITAVGETRDGERVAVNVFRNTTAMKALVKRVAESVPALGLEAMAHSNGHCALTARELEVLRFIAHGHNTAAVASRLHVSRATIRNHVQNIFAKLDVHSRLEAVAYATRNRIF